ncbi:probable RNA-binding protein 46 isoform X2 [Leptinotarsa decemlineata]
MRPKLHIGVYKSVDNCRLFIGNLPEDKTKEDVVEMLSKYVDGITNVIMYPNYEKPWLSRGFVFVEFQTHRLAAMARRQFAPDNLIAWGQRMHVDWADPLPEVDPKIMTKVTVLYLRNVPFKYTEAEVHTCVCSVVGSRIVTKLHKMLNYAFVHFSNRSDAEFAKQKLQNFVIGNRLIEVEWAIPRRFSKKNRLNCGPNNFCTSVPPNMRRLVQQRLKSLDSPSRCSSVLSYEKKSKQCESVSDILSRMSLQGSSKSYVETSSYISDEITSGTWSSDATDNFYHGNASSYIPDEISSEAWGLDSNESYYAIDKTGHIPDKMSSQACALMFTESGGPLDYFNGYNFVNHTF